MDVDALSKAPRKEPLRFLINQPSEFEQQCWETPQQSINATRLRLESVFAMSTEKENLPLARFQ